MEYLLITILITTLLLCFHKKEKFVFEKQKQEIIERVKTAVSDKIMEYMPYLIIFVVVIAIPVSMGVHTLMNSFFGSSSNY